MLEALGEGKDCAVESGRNNNYDHPKRVVIDEVIGGKFRVLTLRMKATATDEQTLDSAAWDEEHAMDEVQLKRLPPSQDVAKLVILFIFRMAYDV